MLHVYYRNIILILSIHKYIKITNCELMLRFFYDSVGILVAKYTPCLCTILLIILFSDWKGQQTKFHTASDSGPVTAIKLLSLRLHKHVFTAITVSPTWGALVSWQCGVVVRVARNTSDGMCKADGNKTEKVEQIKNILYILYYITFLCHESRGKSNITQKSTNTKTLEH